MKGKKLRFPKQWARYAVAILACWSMTSFCILFRRSTSSHADEITSWITGEEKHTSSVPLVSTSTQTLRANTTGNDNLTNTDIYRTFEQVRRQRATLSERFCFVHVGKTAGGTVSCRLNPRLAKSCPVTTDPDNSHDRKAWMFRNRVIGKIHKGRKIGCSTFAGSPPKAYLFATRDPLERFTSWFWYEHPKLDLVNEIMGNRPYLYEECFETLEEMSAIGIRMALEDSPLATITNNGTDTTALQDEQLQKQRTCAKRAWQAVTGQVGFQYHNSYHYRYYWEWVHHYSPNDPDIMVIRQEYLPEDWNRLTTLYGGDPPTPSLNNADRQPHHDFFVQNQLHAMRTNNTSTRDAVQDLSVPSNIIVSSTQPLTPTARRYLCIGLCEELVIYRRIIQAAINLTPQQQQASMTHLDQQCPEMSTKLEEEKCPKLHPAIANHNDPVNLNDIPKYPGFEKN